MIRIVGVLIFTHILLAQGTYTAASCNRTDVNAVINGPTHTAVNGDIINIPSGSCTWTSGITISNKGITVAGAGAPNSTGVTTGASASCTQTVLTLNSTTAFQLQPTYGNSTSRISCMQLTAGTGSSGGLAVIGACAAGGCPNLRMDNITFANWSTHTAYAYGINAIDNMFGVLDHNTVTGSSGYLQLVEFAHAGYLGSGNWGDKSWAEPEDWGTNKFLFAENNSLSGAGLSENEASARAYEDWGGGRMVARFNSFTVTDGYNFGFGWHGTESSGRPRSTRAFEFYGNTYTCTYGGGNCQDMVASRGGNGHVWGNTINHSGTNVATAYSMQNYRVVSTSNPWGACDGSSPYDINDGSTYWSGTVGSVSGSNPATITVSGGSPGWATNQWIPAGAPYSVHDVTKSTGAEIQSNGANTLVIGVGGGGPNDWVPSNGDSIQILRATICMDQPGRGAGQLYAGDFPATPESASNQSFVPGYIWSNVLNNGATAYAFVYSTTGRVIRNRDYYMEDANQAAQSSATSPFNGTTTIGMGHGTLTNRPTTCTAGVGYWATDQGSWNQSGSGGQGQLYKCTATDTWTLYYTPYTYPHPLQGEATTSSPGSSGGGAKHGGGAKIGL